MEQDSLELSDLDQAKRFEQLSRAIALLTVVDIAVEEILEAKPTDYYSLGRGLLLHSIGKEAGKTRYVIEPSKQRSIHHLQLSSTESGHVLHDSNQTASSASDVFETPTLQVFTPQDLLAGGADTAEQSRAFSHYASRAHRFVMRAHTQQKMIKERYYHDVF